MLLLLVSIAVLWTAPWVYGILRRHTRLHTITERALVFLVALLVLINILPTSFRVAGWWAVVLVVAGMALPSLLERAWHKLAVTVHWFPLGVGIVGLAIHASLDGAAFVDPEHHSHTHVHALPLAVVVHRFFEGLFVWLFLRPRFGARSATAALALISLFSILGYWAGDYYFHSIEEAAPFALFQALVAGSLLHLVLDPHDPGAVAMHHHETGGAGHHHHHHHRHGHHEHHGHGHHGDSDHTHGTQACSGKPPHSRN